MTSLEQDNLKYYSELPVYFSWTNDWEPYHIQLSNAGTDVIQSQGKEKMFSYIVEAFIK